MFDRLETDRLVMRRVTLGDVDDLVALDADPLVMRFMTGGTASARADVEEAASGDGAPGR